MSATCITSDTKTNLVEGKAYFVHTMTSLHLFYLVITALYSVRFSPRFIRGTEFSLQPFIDFAVASIYNPIILQKTSNILR